MNCNYAIVLYIPNISTPKVWLFFFSLHIITTMYVTSCKGGLIVCAHTVAARGGGAFASELPFLVIFKFFFSIFAPSPPPRHIFPINAPPPRKKKNLNAATAYLQQSKNILTFLRMPAHHAMHGHMEKKKKLWLQISLKSPTTSEFVCWFVLCVGCVCV